MQWPECWGLAPITRLRKEPDILGLPAILINRNLERIEGIRDDAATISVDTEVLDQTLKIDPIAPGDTKEARRRIEESAEVNLTIITVSVFGDVLGLGLGGIGFLLWY